ncbi:hypothetical protein PCC7424_1881 [Gloeothece citriformis PCC 7424]|uniref:NurA domain-containing protein n=1 Tax=Gloeothece citriformis (strain PCC 7424) TaxID=65393 RepID=B7KDL1_GLOC7|nr:hypothetical protein [Gloeothece citriformis]ACK70313.1 hypothetical protein PCC7424_1881 [Gloeothece citriformis PCC 7424]
MDKDSLRNIVGYAKRIEKGLKKPDIKLPTYRTVKPKIRPSTQRIGALDGSDQQIFSVRGLDELGVAAWATLYIEADLNKPHDPPYRSGPASSGPWTKEELIYFHLTIELHDEEANRKLRNDYYSWRQILTNSRPTVPPIFKENQERKIKPVRVQAAIERATGEWLALQKAITRHLPPQSLILTDGRFNCQLEMAASFVDQLGRRAERNQIRAVAVVKAGLLYDKVSDYVYEIATEKTNKPFYFLIPHELIEECYGKNEKNPVRKTLMVGGKDHTDLAGIGSLWVVFCPDPSNYQCFVILEFNLYNLAHYKALAWQPIDFRQWHTQKLGGASHSHDQIWVTDLRIDEEQDLGDLVEPTIEEILWLCESEIRHFGYPNLLGIAHKEVVLNTQRVKLLRDRYMEVFAHSNEILRKLVGDDYIKETPHKIHNIDFYY